MPDADRRRVRSVRSPRPRVVIAGGGVAAIEALLALRHLVGEQVSIQLLAPDHVFVHRPSSVARPFGLGGPAQSSWLPWPATRGPAVAWRLEGVDPARRVALIAGGGGALRRPDRRRRHEPEPCGPRRDLLRRARPGRRGRRAARRGRARRVPAARVRRPRRSRVVAARLRARHDGRRRPPRPRCQERHADARDAGGRAAADLRRRRRRRAAGDARRPRRRALDQHPAAGGARRACSYVEPGTADRAPTRSSACPRSTGPALAGLPADARGFIPVDAHGRVPGVAGVYAAGDATSFPVKQGGLATQQADAAAEAVAADLGLGPGPAALPPGACEDSCSPAARRCTCAPSSRGDEASPPARSAARRGVEPRAVVAARQGRRPLPGALPRHRAPRRPHRRAAARPYARREREPAGDRDEAFQLALLLAEEDAKVGDFHQALHALDAAAALAGGVLPEQWAERRARWQRELAPQR